MSVENSKIYRHKFFWTVIIFTVIVFLAFGFIIFSFNRSLDVISNANKQAINDIHSLLEPAKMSKDSCYYADEHLVASMQDFMQISQSKLEMESVKIQSDFAVLSLWAGILMIVFLVFSIYSMYKTDELLRQSREGLNAIQEKDDKANDIIKRVDDKVREELMKVSKIANTEIQRIKDETNRAVSQSNDYILSLNEQFDELVKDKTETFTKTYDDILKRMKKTSENNNVMVKQLLLALMGSIQEGESNITNNNKKEGNSDEC